MGAHESLLSSTQAPKAAHVLRSLGINDLLHAACAADSGYRGAGFRVCGTRDGGGNARRCSAHDALARSWAGPRFWFAVIFRTSTSPVYDCAVVLGSKQGRGRWAARRSAEPKPRGFSPNRTVGAAKNKSPLCFARISPASGSPGLHGSTLGHSAAARQAAHSVPSIALRPVACHLPAASVTHAKRQAALGGTQPAHIVRTLPCSYPMLTRRSTAIGLQVFTRGSATAWGRCSARSRSAPP